MANPFDLPGPQYLVFYGILGIATVTLYLLWVRVNELSGKLYDVRDPYMIAYLRGGAIEVMRIVLVSLIDRGLLKQVRAGEIEVSNAKAIQTVRRPIERAVLKACESPVKVSTLLSSSKMSGFSPLCEEFRAPLQGAGYIVSTVTLTRRLLPFLVA
ncbi:MAG: TIGR04222 domain-containing membrane protein, partial [Candidatus Hydrogenedentales bacterium]